MAYSQLLKARREVLSDEGIDGIIDLTNLSSGKRKALEKDPDRFFALTYPTADIRRVLEQLDERFNSEKPTAGLFLLEGLKGTGKSHLLLLIYHLFESRKTSAAWLRTHGLQCRLPDDATVVLNKFTDLPLESIWDFILKKLELPSPGRAIVQPSHADIERVIAGRRLILIFDELEQGIRVINDPTIQSQNLAFLQMMSEWGNRSNQITLFASIYSAEDEPGATLKRVPNCRVQFAQFEDRERVVLHRIFENANEIDRNGSNAVVDSYANVWRRHAAVAENYISNFRNSYPFTPDLMDLMLRRVPARGGFQGVRGALGFLGRLVGLTYGKTDIISPAHAQLEDRETRTRLADLDVSGDLIQKASTDSQNLHGIYPLAPDIAAATFLYTVTSPTGSKQRGCTLEELHRGVLSLDTDINEFERSLAAFQKYGAHFHYQEGKYFFDVEEQPDAKVEFKSLTVDDLRARELLRQIWLTDVFHDDGTAVLVSDIQATRQALGEIGKDRLRFVIAPRRLSRGDRHELFDGLELRNQVVLLEPKDRDFDLDHNADLLKWAKRQIAARELAVYSDDAERRAIYERIERQDKTHCATAIRRAGLILIRWEDFGSSEDKDQVEEEIVSGREMSRADVLAFLTTDLFPEQVFIDHLSDRQESLYRKTVKSIERDYQQVPGYPIPVGDMVIRAVKKMCSEARIGLRHSRENVCGRSPNLTASELREATIDPPFVEGGVPPLTRPFRPEPRPGEPEPEPGWEPAPPTLPVPVQDVRSLPKDSPGDLRIEVASRLAPLIDVRVRQVTFKIFFQRETGDLTALPSSVRGALSGSGSVTAEILIVKQGDFSKGEVEQMVEALPALPGAKYDVQLKVVVPQSETRRA